MDPVLKQLFDAETHLFNQALSPEAAAEDGLRYLLPLYQRKSKFKKEVPHQEPAASAQTRCIPGWFHGVPRRELDNQLLQARLRL